MRDHRQDFGPLLPYNNPSSSPRGPAMNRPWSLAFALTLIAASFLPARGGPEGSPFDIFLKDLPWRSIGPALMGGRIDDFAVDEKHPSTIYVGTATGGVFKSINNGTTWTPLFDAQPTSSIGDICIAPSDSNVVWVGTGEANNRQ